jgi:hypothetical protein
MPAQVYVTVLSVDDRLERLKLSQELAAARDCKQVIEETIFDSLERGL